MKIITNNIVQLKQDKRTGRYLTFRKRDYSHTDVIHPKKGSLCRLLSMPKGFLVTQVSESCKHLLGTHHQTPESFEREYLRHD